MPAITIIRKRNLAAICCGILLALFWTLKSNEFTVEGLIIGLICGSGLTISLIKSDPPPPLTTRLVTAILLVAVLVLAGIDGIDWRFSIWVAGCVAFLFAQWKYITFARLANPGSAD